MGDRPPKHKAPGMSKRNSGTHGAKQGRDLGPMGESHGAAAIGRVSVARDERRAGDGRGDMRSTIGPKT